jgi:hypothetical protein
MEARTVFLSAINPPMRADEIRTDVEIRKPKKNLTPVLV